MNYKFIAGLLIGATVVHFLNTEEGKELLNRFKKDAAKMQEEIEGLADDLVQKSKSFMDEVKGESTEPAA